ncbi:MAG: hypothetical protein ABWY36_05440 [Leifsonia sp.]
MADTYVVHTPACMFCGESSAVLLTIEEHRRLFATDPLTGRRVYLIQDALPDREPSFRELVKTGTHPACWDQMFPEED